MSATPIAGEDRKGRLSPAKRKLLEIKLRGRRPNVARNEISVRPPSQNPLSFGQERIWFQCQVTSNAALYHIPLLAWFDGLLDARALEASLNEVIRRHDVLRSGFESKNGAAVQIISPHVDLAIGHVDLQDIDPASQESEVRARAGVEARKPFDLARPPLLRVTLLKLGPARHALLLTVHHIVWDGWSSGLLIREIGQLYTATLSHSPSPLAPLPIQYGDFAYWHRRTMESESGSEQIAYWKKRLEGLPDLSALPTDRPRAAKQAHRGSTHSWRLSESLRDGFTNLARGNDTTLFVVLLATFKALLFHYTGQGDLVVGTTIAFRTRSELENLLGFFANALVLRTQLGDDPSFETFLARVHETALGAQSNQDVPFEKLVEELAPKRGLSHNPLFQVAFVLHNLPSEKLELPGLTIRVEETSTESATFDLVLHIFDERPGLKARLEYDSELFDHATIVRMASHFDALAQSVLTHPGSRISALSLSAPEQERQLIDKSSAKLTILPDRPLLHQSIDIAAEAGAIAVTAGGESLTYGELVERSNRLAHHLANMGVGPDVPVGVFLEPSIDMIVAILGALKADGAYVPIDPSYPAARIQHILADSNAAAVITTRRTVAGLPDISTPVVFLDADAAMIGANPTRAAPSRAGPDNLAYLIYTSGSTGLPKGVMVSHRNAVASTLARRQFYAAPVKTYLLLSSIAFDSSVAGIFWTLFEGGRLCIPGENIRRDPGALMRMIEQEAVSHLLCLPSLYSVLSSLASPTNCASLECVIVAGEECRGEVAARHFDRVPRAALFNEYGPTECAVWSTVHEIKSEDRADAPISIGRPIPGAQAFVVGPGGTLLPPGVPGELYVGGQGLARGYRGRADLTAERFLPNPFGEAGERLYRTGDRVRLRADGDIEFLGRVDNQVKVRGYRIEPAEIEKALLRHPSARDVVVIASSDKTGGAKLLAYLVTAAGAQERDADFKQYLSEHLPDYMVPDSVVILASLPRLPNGKIDRGALPATSSTTSSRARANEPSSAIAALMAEIWREVLSIEDVGDDDNFFDLGGNSLSAIQVIARAQQLLGKDIPIASIFDDGAFREFVLEVERCAKREFADDELNALLAEIEEAPEPGLSVVSGRGLDEEVHHV
ncbi:non-ribosomal peptide synthetase [Methylosinus sp. RM1]|uniref:non-ribosomal peptide synthetase n=1 Tax=Methylosinus sp. RM1 TaxID=2583817 RepID=UPI00140ACF40|nr:non-ribosomal peptide synthetase [Methylosinus sp. RM1]